VSKKLSNLDAAALPGYPKASMDAISTSLTVTTGQRPNAKAKRAASWCLHCKRVDSAQVSKVNEPMINANTKAQMPRTTC